MKKTELAAEIRKIDSGFRLTFSRLLGLKNGTRIMNNAGDIATELLADRALRISAASILNEQADVLYLLANKRDAAPADRLNPPRVALGFRASANQMIDLANRLERMPRGINP
jgi:hypothetical protein